MSDPEFLCAFFGIRDTYSFSYAYGTHLDSRFARLYDCVEGLLVSWLEDNEEYVDMGDREGWYEDE